MLQILSKHNINTPFYFNLLQETSDYICSNFQYKCAFY